ncbi:extracellular solute-binding protein [Bdellovibrio reynosensis]|uniref:Extracellular solute-binding protein n=1 Tax=Bdellovibrio reynosensis TaxID=2835041 RepID=A0ABY4CB90_9BACT|nr:extracellular solute-binding protein [Bdellovibrio reynosensis]UOF00946.1 extracellular solute-binding protein [Bdellovibrio reynosensis]
MKKLVVALLVSVSAVANAETLTILTDRPAVRLQPLVEQFKKEKGVDVIVVEKAYADMETQLVAEGTAPTADLIYIKDLVLLDKAVKKDLFQPLTNASVKARVLPAMKDHNDNWVAVSYRARTLVYDASRVDVSDIKSYEDLADSKFAGRICLRTSGGTYNVALIANLVVNKGETAAKDIFAGILSNLATDVFKNDTLMMQAIATGVCDIGIANTYYLGQAVAANPNFPVKPLFVNQDSTGVHTNGTGVGVVKHSQKAALAQEFIALMLTDSAQLHLSSQHMEYPAAVGLTANTLIANWGTFKVDAANWSIVGEQVPAAERIIKELDYK